MTDPKQEPKPDPTNLAPGDPLLYAYHVAKAREAYKQFLEYDRLADRIESANIDRAGGDAVILKVILKDNQTYQKYSGSRSYYMGVATMHAQMALMYK